MFFALTRGGIYIFCFHVSSFLWRVPFLSSLVLVLMLRMMLRKHRYIIETTHTLLISSFVPTHLWGEAISMVVYHINIWPSSHLQFPGKVFFVSPPT
jgi:hypothetical protein